MNEELPEYNSEEHKKFVEDMKAAGLSVRDYRGRNFYHGPGVVVPSIQMVLSATKVVCTWDHMGKEWIVYPRR